MQTTTIPLSQLPAYWSDSSRRARTQARMEALNEATMNALRQAGAGRAAQDRREQEQRAKEAAQRARAQVAV